MPADLAHCPHCGAVALAPRASGSGLLRPLVAAPDVQAETPLIDHEHALRRLRTAWRQSHSGQGQIFSLVGENGSGRSRLIRELAATIDADAPDALWLVGQAHSVATYQPFHLLADLLAPWGGDGLDHDAPTRLATALERFATLAAAADRWSLLALAREARETDNPASLPLGPLAESLARAIRHVAVDVPLVIVLEDLEWCDASSLAALDLLLARLTQATALVICTHHSDWSHEWPDIARHTHFYLGPLPYAESLRLIGVLDPDQRLPLATIEALAFAAGGNPLLLEQATLATLEHEQTDALVPATLTEAIQARLVALSPQARSVLYSAATLGSRFSYRAIAMITEATLPDRTAIDHALRELARRRLIIRWSDGPEAQYRFAHGLIHEIAYTTIAADQRAALESRVADWLLSESALEGGTVTRTVSGLDQRADRVVEVRPQAAVSLAAPRPIDLRRRGEALARIVLADQGADQRASLAFCLQHGYSYAEAGEILGIGAEEVRENLYNARKRFKRLYDASVPTPDAGRVGEER